MSRGLRRSRAAGSGGYVVIRKLVAAGVAEHVSMGLDAKLGRPGCPLDLARKGPILPDSADYFGLPKTLLSEEMVPRVGR
jgi:hypothetical protein